MFNRIWPWNTIRELRAEIARRDQHIAVLVQEMKDDPASLVVAAPYTSLSNMVINGCRRIYIAPGSHSVSITGCYFPASNTTPVTAEVAAA